MRRRVVVTGVGMLCSVGTGTEECWTAILAGKAGIGQITQFDASQFSCRIAGEIKNFDPLKYVDKKEVKKMGRFIQFAMAASEFAVSSAKLESHPADAEMFGVYIGSGIGGFEVIEREHLILLERGPSRHFAVLHPILHRESSQWLRIYQIRRKRAQFRHSHSLHYQRAFHRRFLPSDSAWLCRCDDLRRQRSVHHTHGHWRFCGHACAFHPK